MEDLNKIKHTTFIDNFNQIGTSMYLSNNDILRTIRDE